MKQVETYLRDYHKNLARIDSLQLKLKSLTSVHGVDLAHTCAGTGTISDPVAHRMERLEDIELQILDMELITQPITQLLQDLNEDISPLHNEYLTIINEHYFQHRSAQEVADTLSLTEATFRRRKHAIRDLASDYCDL